MHDLLEMPEVRARISKVSVADYHAMIASGRLDGRRVELMRGLLIEKMPKSYLRRLLSLRAYNAVHDCAGSNFYCMKEDPLTFIDSEPEPDVSVVRGGEEKFLKENPTTAALVIEVAVSSASLDRANAPLYAENGIEEYWIVLAEKKQVEIWSDPQDSQYQTKRVVASPAVLQCGSVPTIRVALGELFAGT